METKTKDLGMETHPGEGVMKEETFSHSRKPSHRHVYGEFWNLRGQHNQEKEKTLQNVQLTATTSRDREVAQSLLSITSEWGLGREARTASPFLRVRTRLECPENNLRELM